MGYLSEAEHLAVTEAVAAAEARTAGEIVTVIAERSDGYSDIAIASAAVVAFTAIACLTFWPDFFLGLADRVTGGWNNEWTPRGIFGLALFVGIVKFAAMWLIQLWRPLKFLLIPGPIKSARTNARAIDLFKVGAERRTHGRTGVIIYLSMRERRAEIVADRAISDKVAPEVWGEAMAAMLAELKQGRCADGMVAAVERVGKVLAEHFPRAEDDHNELPDRLIEV